MNEKQLAGAANGLGFNLLPHIHKAGETTVFFPSSLTPVTAMLLEGAGNKSDTQKQLRTALGLATNQTKALAALLMQLKDRSAASKDFELLVENAIWTHERFPLRKAYLNRCRKNFKAVIDSLDFADAGNAAEVINKWADDNTKHRIKEVVTPDMFDDTTRLVAANATAFDGIWDVEFDKKKTKPQDFTLSSGKKVKADTMYTTGSHLSCWELAECDVLKLPYKGDASLLVALPPQGKNVTTLFPSLGKIVETVSTTDPGYWDEIHGYLPRIKAKSDIKLIPPFRAIGVNAPFDAWSDFTKMIELKSNQYVTISEFLQKAMIEIDEKGSRGAAVTVAIGRCVTTSIGPRIKSKKTVRCDRPFVAMVQDNLTGLIIAIVVVEDPTK